ncbi:MAG: ABC transporter substrate-binding protein [Flavobacteriales bacterium]|nr:ABC transporter substrate-binding protein [Flavobacteriales bacterium]
MKGSFFIIISVIFILTGCINQDKKQSNKLIPLKGGANYGGVFRFNLKNDYKSLFPHSIIESSSWFINEQVYEGLVEADPNTLEIIPELAESWAYNEADNSYVFKIRKGVFFIDDSCFTGGKGRELTAHDIKFCFDKLCEARPDNIGFSYTFADKVKGANAYYKESALQNFKPSGVDGITVLDDFGLKIELNQFDSDFLNILTMSFCWIFPKEAYQMYGEKMENIAVGTGPFYIKSIDKGRNVNLTKNENYWKKDKFDNQLPYLDGIVISFIADKRVELIEFKKGNLDMVSDLRVDYINEFYGAITDENNTRDKFIVQVQPGLNTSYISFNHQSDKNTFKDKNVRMAFRLAINQRALVNATIETKGEHANKGLVPPSVIGYKFDSLVGFSHDPQRAIEFFKKAGYGNGKKFPPVSLTVAGENSDFVHIGLAIQDMLKETLNVDIDLDIVPYSTSIEIEKSGDFDVFLNTWSANYNSPQSFLNLLYGKHTAANSDSPSLSNRSGFQDLVFDSLLEEASRTTDQEKRYALYLQADQVSIDEVAIIPLYYGEVTRLLQNNVMNYVSNSLEEKNLHNVYFATPVVEEKK